MKKTHALMRLVALIWLILSVDSRASAQDIFKFRLGMPKEEAVQRLRLQKSKFDSTMEGAIERMVTKLEDSNFTIRNVKGTLTIDLNTRANDDKVSGISWVSRPSMSQPDFNALVADITRRFGTPMVRKETSNALGSCDLAGWVVTDNTRIRLFFYFDTKIIAYFYDYWSTE